MLAPHISEKPRWRCRTRTSTSFRVRRDATKPEIKAAVELMFEVKVDAVQVVNETGKTKRFGKRIGPHAGLKKAYVRLAPGQTIDYAAETHRRSRGKLDMALIKIKPTSPGRASSSSSTSSHLHKGGPHAAAHVEQEAHAAPQQRRPHHHAPQGRRSQAQATASSTSSATRTASPGKVERLEYDPNRTAHIALRAVRRRRAPLHPRAEGHQRRRRDRVGRRCADQVGQRACRCATSRSARSCTTSS